MTIETVEKRTSLARTRSMAYGPRWNYVAEMRMTPARRIQNAVRHARARQDSNLRPTA
jgi:hypothetical protein